MPTKKANPETELETLLPDTSFHSTNGAIEVVRFPFGLWRKAIAIYNRRAPIFAGGEDAAAMLLAEDGEALEDLAALALLACPTLEREALDNLPGDEAIALMFKVFEVNASFFIRAITKGSEAVAKAFKEDGAGLSKPSLATDTDGPTTSSDTP
jgi:hypothetical protein